jgi:hypothetical protein
MHVVQFAKPAPELIPMETFVLKAQFLRKQETLLLSQSRQFHVWRPPPTAHLCVWS